MTGLLLRRYLLFALYLVISSYCLGATYFAILDSSSRHILQTRRPL